MKKMLKKEFMEKYVTGIKNYRRNKTAKYYINEISFCPAHEFHNFLLSYKFPCVLIHNHTANATILFIQCVGLFNIDYSNDNKEGYAMAFHGIIDADDLLNDLLKKKGFKEFLNKEYFKYQSMIRQSA